MYKAIANKGNKDRKSSMSQLTSATEANQDSYQSISSKAEKNQNSDQSTSSANRLNQDVSESASLIAELEHDSGPSTSSTAGSYEGAGQSALLTTETNQEDDPTLSTIGTNQDVHQSICSTTETNRTFELILSAAQINRNSAVVEASTLDDEPPTENDPLLPPDPPAYHDIIPLFDDGSNIPPPPSSIFKNLFCCFFGAYHLYYARKIRNSRFILILLVACLALPVSALYMGFKYYFSCPVTPHTPLILCVMGGVGLLLTILRLFTLTSRSFRNLGVCEPPRIIVESSAILIACLMIVEMIQFYRILPVFDEPANSHYCPKLLHEYVFYANYVVPAIGILALFLHIPTKPANNLERILQEAADRDTLRQQQNVEGDTSEVYTAWVKPRRRKARRNEENSKRDDFRSRDIEDRVDIRATSCGETAVSGTVGGFQRDVRDIASGENTMNGTVGGFQRDLGDIASGETTMNGTVGGFQRDLGEIASGEAGVCWMDESDVVKDNTINNQRVNEGGPILGSGVEGEIEGQVVSEEYATVGAGEEYWSQEAGAVWGDIEEGAVGGEIGEGAAYGGFDTLLWDEREGLDTPPRNRSSTFTINRVEENVASDFSEYHRRDEENSGLRSGKFEEGFEYGTRRKTRVAEEGGGKSSREESNWDDANPLQTENAVAEVGAFSSESRVEDEDSSTRWHEYGARPKIKVKYAPRTKEKEGTESKGKLKIKRSAFDGGRSRQTESNEMVEIILRSKEDVEWDPFGNQENIGIECGIRRKVKVFNNGSKMKDVLSGSQSIRQSITEGTERDTEAKMKENIGDTIEKGAENDNLPKSEDRVDGSVTPKMKETTKSCYSKKRKKRDEDDDMF